MVMEYNHDIPVLRPYIDFDNSGFWEAVRQHRLVFQKCQQCGLIIHRPRPMCPQCLSTDKEWVRSEGNGTVYSYANVTYQNAGYPGIKAPYTTVLVEMTEGVRILSNMYDVEPDAVYIGMPVQVVFEDIADDLTLPKFKQRAAR